MFAFNSASLSDVNSTSGSATADDCVTHGGIGTAQRRQWDRLGYRHHRAAASISGSALKPTDCLSAAAKRVSIKYRTAAIRRAEYLKLKAIVPAVSSRKSVSKLTVIEEAIKYIDHLHSALATRMTSHPNVSTLSDDTVARYRSLTPDEFVRQLCFGSFLQRQTTSSADTSRQRTASHKSRRPLADKTLQRQMTSSIVPVVDPAEHYEATLYID